jgi:MFS family permease
MTIVALANAVVADVATSAERGIYIGITGLSSILAPSLGPILVCLPPALLLWPVVGVCELYAQFSFDAVVLKAATKIILAPSNVSHLQC